MRGIKSFLLLLALIFVFSISCAPANPTPAGAVVDDLGRPVNIEKIPQRIVSLAPSCTEILFALGLGEKVVGVTEYCDYPPEAASKERIGGLVDPNVETILALKPDLILASDVTPEDVIVYLKSLRLTVFVVKSTDLDDLLHDINTIGKITGKEDEVQSLTSDMRGKIEMVTNKTKALENRPRTFQICWHEPIYTAGNNTYVNDLIEAAGGANIFARDFEGYKSVDIEQVIARDPEVIIVTTMAGEAHGTWEWVNTEPRLANISARQNERVHFVESRWVERPGPRVVLGLEALAKYIHPEIFGEPEGDMTK
jgi:iron complex transport system substrate-binding protein